MSFQKVSRNFPEKHLYRLSNKRNFETNREVKANKQGDHNLNSNHQLKLFHINFVFKKITLRWWISEFLKCSQFSIRNSYQHRNKILYPYVHGMTTKFVKLFSERISRKIQLWIRRNLRSKRKSLLALTLT